MVETCFAGSGDNNTFSTNSANRYDILGSSGGWEGAISSEANVQISGHGAATAKALYLYVGTNTRVTNTVFALRVNGADSALAITVPGGSTGVFSVTGSVSIADGDDITIRRNTGGSGGGITCLPSVAFEVSGQSYGLLGSSGALALSNAGTAYTYAFARGIDWSGTENNVVHAVPDACVASRLGVRVSANTHTVGATCRLRINTADGNQTVTVPATTTGEFIDTSNSDTLASADRIDMSVVRSSGTGTITFSASKMKVEENAANESLCMAGGFGGTVAVGETKYTPLWGTVTRASSATTRTDSQHAMPAAGTASRLTVRVLTNNANNSSTFGTEKNGSAGNQSVTIPSSTTGTFQDLSNSDTFAAGDRMGYVATTTAGSGSFAVRTVAMLLTASTTSTATGSMTGTDGADSAALTGTVLVQGSFSGADGADDVAVSGDVIVQGAFSGTDGADAVSLQGIVPAQGAFALTDGADDATLQGQVIVTGSFSVTDGADLSDFTSGSLSTGSLAATDGADAAAVSGGVIVQGAMTGLEGVDTVAAQGQIIVHGLFSGSDGADSASGAGTVLVQGQIGGADGADSVALTGGVLIVGAFSGTDGADTFAATGILVVPSAIAAGRLSPAGRRDRLASARGGDRFAAARH